MMLDSWYVALGNELPSTLPAGLAEHAAELRFARWLVMTGRLSDWDSYQSRQLALLESRSRSRSLARPVIATPTDNWVAARPTHRRAVVRPPVRQAVERSIGGRGAKTTEKCYDPRERPPTESAEPRGRHSAPLGRENAPAGFAPHRRAPHTVQSRGARQVADSRATPLDRLSSSPARGRSRRPGRLGLP